MTRAGRLNIRKPEPFVNIAATFVHITAIFVNIAAIFVNIAATFVHTCLAHTRV